MSHNIDEVIKLVNDGQGIFIDVRESQEWEMGYIQNSLLIPLSKIKNSIDDIELPQDKDLFLYCRSGQRSQTAAVLLNKKFLNSMRNLMDVQFEDSYNFFLKLFAIYFITFVLPLVLFILHRDHQHDNMIYIYWSMIGGAFFTAYEIIQMLKEGTKEYFKTFWNLQDMIGLTIYWVYVAACISNRTNQDFRSAIQIYMMTAILTIMFSKICFFIRIFNDYGLLVNLVQTCLSDIVPFCIFLTIWLICFYLLYHVTGIESPDRSGQLGVNHENIQDFFYIWSNSIGNIHYWASTTVVSNEYVMALMSLIWFLNQFFVVIILLNFLIAVIS